MADLTLNCTVKHEAEGVKGVVHTIGHALPIHHVLPLHTIGHVAGSVANHTIGQIIPLGSKDAKEKKKKRIVVDISSLAAIHLSTDTVKPLSSNLQIEIVSAYSHDNKKTNTENNPDITLDVNSDDDDDFEIEKATELMIAEKKKQKFSVKNLSMNSFSTGQSAVKSVIKMSNPAKHLSHTFMVIKAINHSHTTKKAYGKRPVWGESVFVDVSENDFEKNSIDFPNVQSKSYEKIGKNSGESEGIKKSGSTRSGECSANFESSINSSSVSGNGNGNGNSKAGGFQVFLYRGVSGMEHLVGYQYVPFSLLLPLRSNNAHFNFSRYESNDSNSSIKSVTNDQTYQNQNYSQNQFQHQNQNQNDIPYITPNSFGYTTSDTTSKDAAKIHRSHSDASLSNESLSQAGSGNV